MARFALSYRKIKAMLANRRSLQNGLFFKTTRKLVPAFFCQAPPPLKTSGRNFQPTQNKQLLIQNARIPKFAD
jgi:hypothetical protein